ncbi:MAG: hypothetical protein ACP5D2_03935 [Candidatus Nanoarchaeia archaeon]
MVREHKIYEFELNDKQIERFIEKLNELKLSQEHLHFVLNKDEELFIKHRKRSFG